MNKTAFILAIIVAVATAALDNVLRFQRRHTSHHQKNKLKISAFKYRDCGGQNIKVVSALETPDPFKIPGNISVSIDANFTKGLQSPLPTNLLIQKRVGKKFLKLPCIDQFGSCYYDDLCDILDLIGDCPDPVTKAGLTCQCPFKAGNYNVTNVSFYVDYSSTLLTGDYMLRGNISINSVQAACIEVNLTVVQADEPTHNRWSKPFKMH